MTDPVKTTQALCISEIIHICFNNQRNSLVTQYSLMLLHNEIEWRLHMCKLKHIKFEVLSHIEWCGRNHIEYDREDLGIVHIVFENKLLQNEIKKYYYNSDLESNDEITENEYIEHLKKYDPYRWNESQNDLMNKLSSSKNKKQNYIG